MKKTVLILLLFLSQFSYSTTPTGDAEQFFCDDYEPTIATIIVTGSNIIWFTINNSAGNQLPVTTPLINGETYYAFDNTDIASGSLSVTVQYAIPAPDGDSYIDICIEENISFNELPVFITNNGSNTIYWFTSSTQEIGTQIDALSQVDIGIYYAFQGLGPCAQSLEIEVRNIEPVPAPFPEDSYVCGMNTLADLPVSNTAGYDSIYWFSTDNPNSENLLNPNTIIEQGATYYAFQGFGVCSIGLQYTIPLLDCNSINGKIQIDVDNNGCDSNDISAINVPVITTNGTSTFYSYSNYLGNYSQNLPNNALGNYTTTLNVPSFFDVSPNSLSTTFTNSNLDFYNQDFCLTANQAVNDVEIEILPGLLRSGLVATIRILYRNNGSSTLDGDITLTFDDSKMSFLNATETVSSQTSNNLTFNYTALAPFETRHFDITFSVFQPPTTNLGDQVGFSATINPITDDINPNDNNVNIIETIVDSSDPNDVTCLEGDTILEENTDKYLHYVIRFQNEGTADAINIRVENQLDSKLDWNSLQIIDSSHSNRVEMENGLINFIFSDVNLPFTEPDSKGYIFYKVKPKANVVLGDVFENQAHIFFDFNAAVDTNIATTEVVNTASVDKNTLLDFTISPMPITDSLNINTTHTIQTIEIYSSLGQLLLANQNQKSINTTNLKEGIYFCKVVAINGSLGIETIIKK